MVTWSLFSSLLSLFYRLNSCLVWMKKSLVRSILKSSLVHCVLSRLQKVLFRLPKILPGLWTFFSLLSLIWFARVLTGLPEIDWVAWGLTGLPEDWLGCLRIDWVAWGLTGLPEDWLGCLRIDWVAWGLTGLAEILSDCLTRMMVDLGWSDFLDAWLAWRACLVVLGHQVI
jgi:hypothetical protein